MRFIPALLAVLVLAIICRPAYAELKPEPHPSAKGKKPTTSWVYDYWTTGTWKVDGVTVRLRVKCHVDRKGRHTCKVEVPA